jgi:pyruvate formate lyase activating enzyme
VLGAGGEGRCRVRLNREGKPGIPFYGFVTALAADPIEKKPLYHYRPSTEILSAGFAGCNLSCPFCQNWRISQSTDAEGRTCTPAELAGAAERYGQIAYTYSEPLVHIEFLLDCMREAREAGIANVLVSNGCVNPGAAVEILALADAANIDLKCFSEETYSKTLGSGSGGLAAVTGFIRAAFERGVHLELTTLVVPGLNDSRAELDKCRDFIAELGAPWHLSAYHPDYRWRADATDTGFLLAAASRAREKIAYVYTGNIAAGKQNLNDTACPHCGKTIVTRNGYRIAVPGLLLKEENGGRAYFCAACGKPAPVRW